MNLRPATLLVTRFRNDFEASLHVKPPSDYRLGVAVSGGPDSLALLLLAAAAYPGRVEAATVDHRVRHANASEAEAVRVLCETLGVEHATLSVDNPLPANPNQAWARDLRYTLLEWWTAKRELSVLLTAHHLDDQAETLLMRANRGSGVSGLASVRATSLMVMSEARLVRPLLGWRRPELRAIVDDADLSPVDDPSNHDRAFDRTAARTLLAQNPYLRPERLAATATAAADAEEALNWTSARLWEQRRGELTRARSVCVDLKGIPREYLRRIIRIGMDEVRETMTNFRDGWTPRGASIDRLLRRSVAERSVAGWNATLGGVLITVSGDTWCFAPAPPRRAAGP